MKLKFRRSTILTIFAAIFVFVVVYHYLYGHFFKNRVEGLDRQWHENVDIVYYINLDSREDRKTEFLGEMRRMGVPDKKISRISAVNKPGQGDWGCSLSHILAIEDFIDSGLDNCIVFEDDFTFTQDLKNVNAEFESVFSDDNAVLYNVIMLSANEVDTEPTDHKYLKKVADAQTTSGYMVSKSFAPILLQNYRDGVKLLADSYKIGKSDALQGPFCIDQYWKRIQPRRIGSFFLLNWVFRGSHIRIFRGVLLILGSRPAPHIGLYIGFNRKSFYPPRFLHKTRGEQTRPKRI